MADNPAFRLQHEMASAMKGLDFPADRDEIITHARDNDASDDVIEKLSRVSKGEYQNVAQVMDATNN